MPDRIIRDELLHSERYWSVSVSARIFFVHLMLVVDDTARFSGNNFSLRSACFPEQGVTPKALERMLAELISVDLVRTYDLDAARFIFIPRFRQRLRFLKSKYPSPPIEVNDLVTEKTDHSQSIVRLESDHSQTIDGRSEEKRSRSKPRLNRRSPTSTTRSAVASLDDDDGGFAAFWQAYPRHSNKQAALKAWSKLEPDASLQNRIAEAIDRQRASLDWQRDDGQFIPYPASWLNARRWEDEIADQSTRPRNDRSAFA